MIISGGAPRATSVAQSGAPKKSTTGVRLATFREHLGLKQHEAAGFFGVSLRTWVRYEGSDNPPKRAVLSRLADAGLNVPWLLAGETAGPMLVRGDYRPITKVSSGEKSESYNGIDGPAFEASLARARAVVLSLRELEQLVASEAGRFEVPLSPTAVTELARVLLEGHMDADGLVQVLVIIGKLTAGEYRSEIK